MSSKYIFILGGVTSSLGKGIIAASIGKLLQSRGYRTTIQKFDPYINIDPGTMNPYEHGECYVTEDGTETDLDLGHYERFLNIYTSKKNNITTGQIYYNVIKKERRGDYLGKTVQVIPHITDEIKKKFFYLSKKKKYDIIITEIGGCVGDIESLPFVEAIRQCKQSLDPQDIIVIYLTLIPYLKAAKELKTKPTQHSVKTLLELGIQPDVLICRTEYPISQKLKEKIALFCNMKVKSVIEAINAKSIYEVPILMLQEELDKIILEKLQLPYEEKIDLDNWNNFLYRLKNPLKKIKIGLIGKYVSLRDAYKSIDEALIHAQALHQCSVKIVRISSDKIKNLEDAEKKLKGIDGVIVAPGFGHRGIEGKLFSIRYVRENKIPFLGICLGLQCAIIEFAQNVLHLENTNSSEFEKCTHPVISLLEGQKNIKNKGGTMRKGSYRCDLKKDTLTSKIYSNKEFILERHRHRFEFNNQYIEVFKKNNFIPTGFYKKKELVEIMELKDHPFFIGTQFHPELKSSVENPHPLFTAFLEAVLLFMKNKS